ncbi:MAG: methylated-DNA--[protein]-cysteine S-methyltransferase [Burkholderiaceae bacterium]|jgi:methylated-DNA-[protein]-cysteine S-methyltransferase|nr:methylated-DNA--[protein]-cysteine S-methyltransferase [Burkholderiaceae bacterium]
MTALAGHTLFDTAIGPCGIAWGPRGIAGVQLPEADAEATRARLLRFTGPLPQAMAPPEVLAAIREITALLAGEPHDMSAIVLDLSGLTDFQRRVYALARAIPAGQTRSYGELAEDLGGKHLARAVGQALGFNPFAPVVPCHRILAAGQRPGGFSAHGGAATKLRMLAAEGAGPNGTGTLF